MSQKENKPFQWDDNLVKKFANDLFIDVMADDKAISDFKASHSSSEKVEKDWEILSFVNGAGNEFNLHKNGKYYFIDWMSKGLEGMTLDEIIESNMCSIHSVRRISDNTVWTVDESVVAEQWGEQKIIRFFILKDNMVVEFETCRNPLSSLKKTHIPEEKPTVKPPIGIIPEWLWKEKRLEELRDAINRYQDSNINVPAEWRREENVLNVWYNEREDKKPLEEKPVLFTTEDGVELTNRGEQVWAINRKTFKRESGNGNSIGAWLNGWYTTSDFPSPKREDLSKILALIKERFAIFSTEQAANEYVIMNKPVLSVNEVMEIWREDEYFPAIAKQLASSKIKGGEGI